LLASRTEARATGVAFVSLPRKGLSMNDAIHNFAAGLYFEPYAIDQLVDASRHHRLPLDPEFPFAIKAFSYETFVPGERLTWHNRLEIFCPVRGSGHFQMGERVLDFGSGDLLVVDNLNLDGALTFADKATRPALISFPPYLLY